MVAGASAVAVASVLAVALSVAVLSAVLAAVVSAVAVVAVSVAVVSPAFGAPSSSNLTDSAWGGGGFGVLLGNLNHLFGIDFVVLVATTSGQ